MEVRSLDHDPRVDVKAASIIPSSIHSNSQRYPLSNCV